MSQPKRNSSFPEEIAVGKVVGIHGVRGDMRVVLFNRGSDVLAPPRKDLVLVRPGQAVGPPAG